jgi:uncharacterized RDD family membrane protein YckC/sulfur relay (sulfurtransferase) DsrC/TusE family protein
MIEDWILNLLKYIVILVLIINNKHMTNINFKGIEAGVLRRLLSVIIDVFFLSVVIFLMFELGAMDLFARKFTVSTRYIILLTSIYLIYYVFPMGLFAQTLGCHLVGIKVVTKDLSHIGRKSLKRNIFHYILLNIIGIGSLLLGNKNKIDKTTNTFVIIANKNKKTKVAKIDFILFWLFLILACGLPLGWMKLYHTNGINIKYDRFDFSKFDLDRNKYSVIRKIGTVSYFRKKTEKTLKLDTVLRSNDEINTQKESIVIITYKNNELSNTYKIAPSTRIKLTSFRKKTGKKEISGEHLFLEFGRSLINVNNNTKDERVRVETKSAFLGVRGTRFIVDASNSGTKVFVKEGIVNIYNKVKRSNVLLKSGSYYTVQNDGEEMNLDPKNYSIDWELNDTHKFLKTRNIKPVLINSTKTVKNTNLKRILQLVKSKIKNEIALYKNKRKQKKASDLEMEQILLSLKDKSKILTDLKCLKSNRTCDLKMKQVLLKRGFPAIKFTSKLRSSMSAELKKYYKELQLRKKQLIKSSTEADSINNKTKLRLSSLTSSYKKSISAFKSNNQSVHVLVRSLVKELGDESISLEFKQVELSK